MTNFLFAKFIPIYRSSWAKGCHNLCIPSYLSYSKDIRQK